MKTSRQKYRRSHWWKFIDWEDVFLNLLLLGIIAAVAFGIFWAITHPGDSKDQVADSVITTLEEFNKNCDSTVALTKSDTVDFVK